MRSIGLIGSLAVLFASAPLAGQGTNRQARNTIPPGQRPPAGMCRIWIDGVAAGRQPAATDCQTAVATKPANSRVIWGDQTPFPGKGKFKTDESRGRTIPRTSDRVNGQGRGRDDGEDKVQDRDRRHDDGEDKVQDRNRRRDDDEDKVKDRDRQRGDGRNKAKGRHGRGDDDEDDDADDDRDDEDGRAAARSNTWPVLNGTAAGSVAQIRSMRSRKGKGHGDE